MKKLVLIVLSLTLTGQISLAQLVPDEQFIYDQMAINHVPGISAAVIIGNEVYWNGNYGYMNLEDSVLVHDSTIFTAYSIGKTVTTACLMHLWDRQAFGLDQNMNDFIPFHAVNPHNNNDSLTPRMLMTHTSSIRDWNSSSYIVVGDPTESLASIMENYLDIAGAYYSENHYWNLIPGSYLHYATAGTGQLGYLVEPLTGMEFKQYARDSLFDPLEMPNTAWFLSELNQGILASGYSYSGGNYTFIPHMGLACYPGFSLRSTALDLANLNIMLLNNGLFNDEQILTEAAVDSMMTVQGPGFSFWIGLAGLGMFKTDHFGDREVWGHYGGGGDYGFAGHFFLSPVEGTGVVVLSNSGQWLDELVEYLFDFAWLVITDIPEETKAEPIDITLYPNPASNNLNVRCTANIAELNIYSFSGQQISCSQGSPGIDISFLAPGIYIIEAKTVEGVVRRKFVKK